MYKTIGIIIAITIAVCISGCGGGGSSDRVTEVSVTSDGLTSRDISITHGDKVIWTNNTGSTIKIASGTLTAPDDTPSTTTISINANGTFSSNDEESDLGDTYKWKNNKTTSVTVEILDESGSIIESIPIDSGAEGSYSDFPRAGIYTFRLADADDVTGTITLLGSPSPDGTFTSGSITAGHTYSTIIFSTGKQSYYVLVGSSETSHITGKITVE